MTIKKASLLTLALVSLISNQALSQEKNSPQSLMPLEDVVLEGASLSYLALRCSGLYVSVLALELPQNLKSIRPRLEGRFVNAHELASEIRADKAGVTKDAARGLIRDDIQAFADRYVQVWNSNYIQNGQYLGETFTEDAKICKLLQR